MMRIMMKTMAVVALFAALGWQLVGPSKLTERSLLGTWELKVEDVDFDKIHDMRDRDRDNLDIGDRLGAAIEHAALTFVSDLLVDFEMSFTFLKDHSAELKISVLGKNETKYLDWEITNMGGLVLKGEDDNHFSIDDVWVLDDGKLVSMEEDGLVWNGESHRVYLVKVK